MKRTDFFVGIGAQRAGTSWLADYLAEHPQVGFSPFKELHYFDARFCPALCGHFDQHMIDLYRSLARKAQERPDRATVRKLTFLGLRLEMIDNPRRYVDYFDLLAEEGHKTVGEITPAYSILDARSFGEILRLRPDARFIFIMRDPLARFWSHLRLHETAHGAAAFNSREQVTQCLSDPRHILRTDYQRTLLELEKVADEARLRVLFFEDLMDPATNERELRKITDFLQIDFQPGDLAKRVNTSKPVALEPHFQREIVERFRYVYEYVAGRFGLPPAWRQSLALVESV